MKWKSLQMPKSIQKDESTYTPSYGKFIIEPLERGYGITLGNSLRRVLLMSLQGAAPVSVKIEGVSHEYSTLPGVTEDVSDILMNLKQLRVKLLSESDAILRLDVQGEGDVTAARFEPNPDVEILNPELFLARINKEARLRLETRISDGRGYVSSEQNKRADDPIGVIPLDALFSPVTKANFRVENTRVGQRTDYDKLVLEIWTDKSITPEDGLSYAGKLLQEHLNLFITFEPEYATAEEKAVDEKTERLRKLLRMRVDELELSVRSSNCLRSANIHTIADLVRNQESEMLHYKNFGRKSLIELNQVLNSMGLSFGMDVDGILGNERR